MPCQTFFADAVASLLAAQVSTKINDMLSKTSSSGALEAFDRMEDKIEKMEAEAEVRGRSCSDAAGSSFRRSSPARNWQFLAEFLAEIPARRSDAGKLPMRRRGGTHGRACYSRFRVLPRAVRWPVSIPAFLQEPRHSRRRHSECVSFPSPGWVRS